MAADDVHAFALSSDRIRTRSAMSDRSAPANPREHGNQSRNVRAPSFGQDISGAAAAATDGVRRRIAEDAFRDQRQDGGQDSNQTGRQDSSPHGRRDSKQHGGPDSSQHGRQDSNESAPTFVDESDFPQWAPRAGSSMALRLTPASSPPLAPAVVLEGKNGDIPLIELDPRRSAAIRAEERESDDDDDNDDDDGPLPRPKKTRSNEAHQLVRLHARRVAMPEPNGDQTPSVLPSGVVTPMEERDPDDYVPPPNRYRGGILSSILKLYHAPPSDLRGLSPAVTRERAEEAVGSRAAPTASTLHATPASSGAGTPRKKALKWHSKSENPSTTSLAGLVESSSILAAPGAGLAGVPNALKSRPHLHPRPPPGAGGRVAAALSRMSRPRLEDEIRITVHIAETLSRQRYLIKLCRALMSFGAPTHRMEEYMRMTARVLEIDGQFLYIPGCMIVSFDDATTHTTEVKLVRSAQGVDLGKLHDVHNIYKEVVHDKIGVEEATQRLDEVIKQKAKHHPWVLVVVYGLASATVGPFAFQARLIDLPMAFVLGSLLGVLQLIVAPKSDLYSNVFEISAAVITSFLARALGSIHGGQLFCFSALAQSSIALILPGYTVLCGSLELQSKNIVAGSVRMVYAIIYSLFLGFGITIGTAVYGLIDSRATSATTCGRPIPAYYHFLFVPAFTLCLIIINQGKWKQAPVMLVIAFVGYVVNFFSSRKFASNAQISNTLGALAVGVLANLYSRLRHGVAAAALLPAIFVLVPSGLAATGSLVSGVTSANQLLRDANHTSTPTTTAAAAAADAGGLLDAAQLNSVVFNVGYSMIQVAIGITVGLFLSALIVYPLGKRRSGLFSF
ncbi:MAG: hypothetical protein M1826_004257 [Phylliscum demangeonii]|nr:MAG: hypothetical protein M1826_004257 [Phylliscum demangeonii]